MLDYLACKIGDASFSSSSSSRKSDTQSSSSTSRPLIDGFIFLNREIFRVTYFSFLVAVTMVPLTRTTSNDDGSDLVLNLVFFLWRIKSLSPTLISEHCACDLLSACSSIFSLACWSFFQTLRLISEGLESITI